jgi:hypothetical protein
MHRAILFALCVALSPTTMAQGIFSRLLGGGGGMGNIERQYRVVKGRKLGPTFPASFCKSLARSF